MIPPSGRFVFRGFRAHGTDKAQFRALHAPIWLRELPKNHWLRRSI